MKNTVFKIFDKIKYHKSIIKKILPPFNVFLNFESGFFFRLPFLVFYAVQQALSYKPQCEHMKFYTWNLHMEFTHGIIYTWNLHMELFTHITKTVK